MNNNQKISILIVEDDTSIAELVKDLLNDEFGYHAVVVSNGALAIELLESIKLDLLVLDIGLPGISGLQIYDWLKANHKLDYMPVMFMTAQAAQYRYELEKRDVRYVVYKPFDLDEFLDVVRTALTASNRSSQAVSASNNDKFDLRKNNQPQTKVTVLDGHRHYSSDSR